MYTAACIVSTIPIPKFHWDMVLRVMNIKLAGTLYRIKLSIAKYYVTLIYNLFFICDNVKSTKVNGKSFNNNNIINSNIL